MLKLENISKSFPGVKALKGISLEILPGEVHAVCGENGAGKSTLMNILSGNQQPDQGSILLNGKEIKINKPSLALKHGIAIVHQQLSLADNLSIAENIFANRHPVNRLGFIDFEKLYKQTQQILEQLSLSLQPQMLIRHLSPAQKQMIEIGKALSSNPAILILDEPTASLTDIEIKTLFAIIKKLKSTNTAIIYISHRLDEIFTIADRVSVLKDGAYQGTKNVSSITAAGLIQLMIGREIENTTQQSSATNEKLLQVKNLSGKRFTKINFTLHKGEILGMAGLAGAGRTEIARAIFGADKKLSGEVLVDQALTTIQHPADAIAAGIGYLPEDRKTEGLFLNMDVADNVIAAKPIAAIKNYLWQEKMAVSIAETYKKQLRIATPHVKQLVKNLSGGNQQKVVLAKWLLADTNVLIVDEPTHGIDVGAKFEIYQLIRQLAKQGKGILMISSELTELIALCDRILVIKNGRVAGELAKENFSEQAIIQLAY